MTELYLEDFKKMFDPELLMRLDRIGFCGNYGDPIVARDLLPIIKHIRRFTKCLIRIHTNGSARRAEWWVELAQALKPNGVVVWGLDGLEDTNAIYRVNTDWNLIMRNVKAFHAAGGVSHWQYIPFEHNLHQISEAREMARELGFKEFIARSPRNITIEPFVEVNWDTAAWKAPQRPPYNVTCSAIERKMIYVSAEGLVFPCCWLANIYHIDPELVNMVKRHGRTSISAKHLHLRDIVEGSSLWAEIRRWRLLECDRQCGSKNERSYLSVTEM